jgi:hypothetical protein
MVKPLPLAGQVLLYALFAAFVGYFSAYPRYRHLDEDQALIKLSFSHPGRLEADCRTRSPDELARLAPNMRAPLDCPRARSPVRVELTLDDKLIAQREVRPAGLSRDGASTVYARFPVAAGEHLLRVRLNDDVRVQGYNYVREERVRLQPGRILVVDFDSGKGGILLK